MKSKDVIFEILKSKEFVTNIKKDIWDIHYKIINFKLQEKELIQQDWYTLQHCLFLSDIHNQIFEQILVDILHFSGEHFND